MNIWLNISILLYCNNIAWVSHIYRFWRCPEIKLKSVTTYYKWEKWRTYWNSGLIPLDSETYNLHSELFKLGKLYVEVIKIRDRLWSYEIFLSRHLLRAWLDCSVVKWSSRGHGFRSQNPHISSQLSIMPSSRDLIPSSPLQGYQTFTCCSNIHLY